MRYWLARLAAGTIARCCLGLGALRRSRRHELEVVMGFEIDVDHGTQVVRTAVRGPIRLADVQAHLAEENEARGLGYPELIDATQATAEFNPADARTIVDLMRHLGHKGKLGPTAVIVADDVSYGMCRMLEILLEDVCPLRPFRTGEEGKAERWLASVA